MGAGSTRGFWGKLPARGDFVRHRLPRRFTDPWDAWLQAVLPGARDGWDDAPSWRFALPAGACGPDAVVGLLLPSVDRVGRRFPLAFAMLSPAGDAGGFLAAAARAGAAALEGEAPERVALLLDGEAGEDSLPDLPDGGALWWREGASLPLEGLPDGRRFAAMMGVAG